MLYYPTSLYYLLFRFGADIFAAARAAGKASRSQEKAIPSPAVSAREAKVQELATNEILPPIVSPNRYIPTFRGTFAARSPYWLSRNV